MSRKLEITIAIAALIVALGAWLFPVSAPKQQSEYAKGLPEAPWYKKLLPAKTLYVSGTGAYVEIHEAPGEVAFNGGEVTSTGTHTVFYVPLGQKVNLDVTGTGATVVVERSLVPHINTLNTATGAVIVER